MISRVIAWMRRLPVTCRQHEQRSSTSTTMVMRQDSTNMVPMISTTLTMLPATVVRMSVKALRAPMVSVKSRLTSAPVWVRAKMPAACSGCA